MKRAGAIVVVAIVAGTTPARADRWLSAEVPVAWAVSEPQSNAFRPGALPALGFYQTLSGWAAVAVRARAGALSDGASPGVGLRDPGYAGLGTLSVAARVTAGGWWLEVAGGGGVTGADLVPTAEIGAGFTRPLGGFEVGPALRILHIEAPEMAIGLGSADLALIGLEVRGARTQPRPRRVEEPRVVAMAAVVERAPRPEPAPVVEVAERDVDPILDEVLPSCRVLAGVVEGGTPGDGCAIEGDVVVHQDRIILSEQVLFDLNRARVRRRARPVIAAIATAWNEQKAWDKLIIEGHADVRGPDSFNVWLSQERADRARTALIEAGVPADRIEAIGHGTDRPRDPGTDEAAHARNRRVEFVIVPRGGAR